MGARKESLKERIIRRSRPMPSGCWIWRGYLSPDGYARARFRGIQSGAHRFAYEAFVGPIPDGHEIDHLCKTRNCVNPKHLEAVTREENQRRAEWNPRELAAKTECLRGHPLSGRNLIIGSDGHRRCRTCQEMHVRAWYEQEVKHAHALGLGIKTYRQLRRLGQLPAKTEAA